MLHSCLNLLCRKPLDTVLNAPTLKIDIHDDNKCAGETYEICLLMSAATIGGLPCLTTIVHCLFEKMFCQYRTASTTDTALQGRILF